MAKLPWFEMAVSLLLGVMIGAGLVNHTSPASCAVGHACLVTGHFTHRAVREWGINYPRSNNRYSSLADIDSSPITTLGAHDCARLQNTGGSGQWLELARPASVRGRSLPDDAESTAGLGREPTTSNALVRETLHASPLRPVFTPKPSRCRRPAAATKCSDDRETAVRRVCVRSAPTQRSGTCEALETWTSP